MTESSNSSPLLTDETKEKSDIRKRILIIDNQIKWLHKIRETLHSQLE